MPEISRFFGIVIMMYFNDHEPPHFHVAYGHHRAVVTIDSLEVTRGQLPGRVWSCVQAWARRYRSELLRNWTLLKSRGTFARIPPLE